MSDRHVISSAAHQIFFLPLFPRERKLCKWNTPRGVVACCNLRLSLKNEWRIQATGILPSRAHHVPGAIHGTSAGLKPWLWYHHKSTFGQVKVFLSSTLVSYNPPGPFVGVQPATVRECSSVHLQILDPVPGNKISMRLRREHQDRKSQAE